DEEFDPAYLRLNSIALLENYCDSVYKASSGSIDYPEIISEVMRRKFYHGYSYYSSGDNPIGSSFASVLKPGIDAIVIPDDIVKFPYAACSQQSIVGMELFKSKGFPVRKVTMFDTLAHSGHFAYEAYYDRGWHFFDTNQEPDTAILNKYRHPSIAFLMAHPYIIAAAYRKKEEQFFIRLLQSSKVGAINKFPAPNAYIYQVTTKFFSIFGWAIAWVIILVGGIVKRRKKSRHSALAISMETAIPPKMYEHALACNS
ncbi:MAG: hypothetical protein ABIR18_07255, partial [Chitinophagaceae bacterium]